MKSRRNLYFFLTALAVAVVAVRYFTNIDGTDSQQKPVPPSKPRPAGPAARLEAGPAAGALPHPSRAAPDYEAGLAALTARLTENERKRISLVHKVSGPRVEGGFDTVKTVITVRPEEQELQRMEAELEQFATSHSGVPGIGNKVGELRDRFLTYQANYIIYQFYQDIVYNNGEKGKDHLQINEVRQVVELEVTPERKYYNGSGDFSSSRGASRPEEIRRFQSLLDFEMP